MSKIILLTGPPGAGKGTQAEIIATQAGWSTFSIGQILRDRAEPELKALMDQGVLLPAEHVVRLVVDEIMVRGDHSLIVDGFPRRLDQAEALDAALKAQGLPEPIVIHLFISQEESWQRLSERGRSDDARHVWERRWEEYREKTIPAVAYYNEQDRLVEVDGSGDITAVTERLMEVIYAAED